MVACFGFFDSDNDDSDNRQAYIHSMGFVMECDAFLSSFMRVSVSFSLSGFK